MLTTTLLPQALAESRRRHKDIYARQNRYLRRLGLMATVVVLYYAYFFAAFGISLPRFVLGCQQIGHYLARMLVWHDVANWPFAYYFGQIFLTIAIVWVGTLTATLVALPLSFLAARNVMSTPALRPIARVVRHAFDIFRGIDMAIWSMVFVRAVGMGPLAGVMAIIVQDVGLLGKLYADGHEAVDKLPGRGLGAVGANYVQKQRFGIYTQSFPTFLALSLYQIESNTRSAAVLGFVGAGGVGLVYAENMRQWNWDVVMFITLVLVAVVMTMDKVSSLLRKKYITGHNIPMFQAPRTARETK